MPPYDRDDARDVIEDTLNRWVDERLDQQDAALTAESADTEKLQLFDRLSRELVDTQRTFNEIFTRHGKKIVKKPGTDEPALFESLGDGDPEDRFVCFKTPLLFISNFDGDSPGRIYGSFFSIETDDITRIQQRSNYPSGKSRLFSKNDRYLLRNKGIKEIHHPRKVSSLGVELYFTEDTSLEGVLETSPSGLIYLNDMRMDNLVRLNNIIENGADAQKRAVINMLINTTNTGKVLGELIQEGRSRGAV